MSKFKKISDVKILRLESYLAAIKNSVGTRIYQHLFAVVDGEKRDIVKGGKYSCNLFVTSILYLHKLCADVHAGFRGTIADLEKSGWVDIAEPRPGALLVWADELVSDDDLYDTHKHTGFYVGDGMAVSNSPLEHVPVIHHWIEGTAGRKNWNIEHIFWNNKLNS